MASAQLTVQLLSPNGISLIPPKDPNCSDNLQVGQGYDLDISFQNFTGAARTVEFDFEKFSPINQNRFEVPDGPETTYTVIVNRTAELGCHSYVIKVDNVPQVDPELDIIEATKVFSAQRQFQKLTELVETTAGLSQSLAGLRESIAVMQKDIHAIAKHFETVGREGTSSKPPKALSGKPGKPGKHTKG